MFTKIKDDMFKKGNARKRIQQFHFSIRYLKNKKKNTHMIPQETDNMSDLNPYEFIAFVLISG